MGGVDVEFQFPNWPAKIRRAQRELNLFIAAQIQFNRGMLFDTEGSHNGRPGWETLKLRAGMILSKRGTLRKSIAPFNPSGTPGRDGIVRFAGDVIQVGTQLAYARMMNDGTTKLPGGVLRPKRAKALKIPLPSGASATPAAKEARAGGLDATIAKEHKALGNLAKRAAKARTFSHRSDAALNRASRAESAWRLKMQRIQKLNERRARIASKGTGGRNFLFVTKVRIPARPFDDWNEQDQADLDGALFVKVAEVLNR